MAERKAPTPEDRVAAVRIALSGIADETDFGELRSLPRVMRFWAINVVCEQVANRNGVAWAAP